MLTPEISTQRLLLRKLKSSDKDDLMTIFMSDEVNALTGNPSCSLEEAEELFRKIFDIYRGALGERFFKVWAIEKDGAYVGHLELKQTPHTQGDEVEVVYMLNPNYWRQGIMTEALSALKGYAHQEGKRIIATVDKTNLPSLELLRRLGVAEEHYLEDDENTVKLLLTSP